MNSTMTLIEKTVFLKSVELFSEVPTEALGQLATRASETRVARGEILFREGDEDQGMFLVVEGELELKKAGMVVRRLEDGMTHGELFLDEHQPHQYTAIAREESLLLNLTRPDVLDALLEYPEIGLAMVKDLALRLHKMTQRLVEVEGDLRHHGSAEAVKPGEPIEPAAPPTEAPTPRGWWRRRSPARPKPEKTSAGRRP